MVKRALAVVLAVLLAGVPPARAGDDAGRALVQGAVALDRRPLAGATVGFIDLATGSVRRAVTGADGAFRAALPPGSYVVAAEGRPGQSLLRAPSVLTLFAGRTVTADLELQTLPAGRRAPAPLAPAPTRPVIEQQAVGCFVARQCAVVQARIRATPPVVQARGYFRSGSGPWYYVNLEALEGGAAGDAFAAHLPAPLDPGPLSYYVSVRAADGSEERAPEVAVRVVTDPAQCGGDAAPPPAWRGTVTVLATGTDTAVMPAGFGDCQDQGAPVAHRHIDKRLLALLGGAAALGIGLTIAINGEPATPSR